MRPAVRAAIAAAILVSATVLGGAAQDAAPQGAVTSSVGGSVSARSFAAYAGDFAYGSAATLSLDLRAKGPSARAEASIETAVLTGSAARTAWLVDSSPSGRPDELFLPAGATASPETALAGRIRSLYAKLDSGAFSLTAGRQVVNFGKGPLWSPVDIFNELDLSGLSPYRRGSDALRLSAALGTTESLDLVAAPTLTPSAGRYAARASGTIAPEEGFISALDWGLMASRQGSGAGGGAWVAGLDLKADIGPSLYADALYTAADSGGGAFRAAAGGDWSFVPGDSGRVILAAEYYHNGGGAAADALFPDAHNAYASLAWAVDEYLSLSLNGTWRIGGDSAQAMFLAALDAAQNASLSVYARLSVGGASGLAADSGLVLKVEF